jgi:chloride channel protein, CIC family
VMATDVVTVEPETSAADLHSRLPEGSPERRQRLYPVVDEAGRFGGVLAWSDVLAARDSYDGPTAAELAKAAVVAYPDETLRHAANRMLARDHGVLPVVDRDDPDRLVGVLTQFDLLRARERVLVEERRRERPLALRRPARPQLGEAIR